LSCFLAGADRSIFVSIVSDGAGSAKCGGQGASLACRAVGARVRNHFRSNSQFPDDDTIWSWIDDARDLIDVVAARRTLTKRDFAATFICSCTDGFRTFVAHVGDGSAVARDQSSGEWRALSWPDQGEYASVTFFLTDDPSARLRISRPNYPIDALAAFTDGIERLALDFNAHSAFQPFFVNMISAVERSKSSGQDRVLSEQLLGFLDSPAVNARTDDDKTLVLAALR
jgi:hypothetical protein